MKTPEFKPADTTVFEDGWNKVVSIISEAIDAADTSTSEGRGVSAAGQHALLAIKRAEDNIARFLADTEGEQK